MPIFSSVWYAFIRDLYSYRSCSKKFYLEPHDSSLADRGDGHLNLVVTNVSAQKIF